MSSSNKKLSWKKFEEDVCQAVLLEVKSYRLMLIPERTEVFHRRKYFSIYRKKEIEFDIAIEGYIGESEEPSLIWIWECKDYSTPVQVDDIEEFDKKLQQIGPGRVKGTVVTRTGFQESAVTFAKSSGIGLATFDKKLYEYTHFAKYDSGHQKIVLECPYFLNSEGEEWDLGKATLEHLIQTELRRMGFLSQLYN